MLITKKFDYTPLTRSEVDGVRRYNTPDGKRLVSVTTILGKTKDMTFLHEWRAAVGETEATRIVTESGDLGNTMHKNLENYIFEKPMSGSFMAKSLANLIIKKGFPKINTIWGSEVALYSEGLYAGTTDLVGVHEGIPSIMDFKNSRQEKKKEWIEDYFMQLAAYAIAHNEMFGTNIKRGVIMMATRDAKYQEFIVEGDEFTHYELMWANKLSDYYTRFEKV